MWTLNKFVTYLYNNMFFCLEIAINFHLNENSYNVRLHFS